jgi:hypothetical protein
MSDPVEEYTDKDIENLRKYVLDHETGGEIDTSIVRILHNSEKMEMVVYRGQKADSKVILTDGYKYFSSSHLLKVAREEFSDDERGCCVFKIHLDKIPTINVNRHLQGKIRDYEEEHEFIFLGGGTFYDSEFMDTPGFYYNEEENIYECWYSFKSPPVSSLSSPIISHIDERSNIEKFFDKIAEEEYAFITDPDEVVKYAKDEFDMTITPEEGEIIFERIQDETSVMKRGKRKHRRSNRRRQRNKQQSKKTKHKRNRRRQSKKQQNKRNKKEKRIVIKL